MREISVSEGLGRRIVQGHHPALREIAGEEPEGGRVRGPVKVVLHGRLIAIGHMEEAGDPPVARLRIERVFESLSNEMEKRR
jgi:hypothetical protein